MDSPTSFQVKIRYNLNNLHEKSVCFEFRIFKLTEISAAKINKVFLSLKMTVIFLEVKNNYSVFQVHGAIRRSGI